MLVLCARSLVLSTAIATRRWPSTCPPLRAETFDPSMLSGQGVVYVCAHGIEGGQVILGDKDIVMFDTGHVRRADMAGSVVWLGGCWGIGPLSEAFLAAGAGAVIADSDVNWTGPIWPTGSNKLGQFWLDGVRRGMRVGAALDRAKRGYARENHGPRDMELLATVGLVGDPDVVVRGV